MLTHMHITFLHPTCMLTHPSYNKIQLLLHAIDVIKLFTRNIRWIPCRKGPVTVFSTMVSTIDCTRMVLFPPSECFYHFLYSQIVSWISYRSLLRRREKTDTNIKTLSNLRLHVPFITKNQLKTSLSHLHEQHTVQSLPDEVVAPGK